MISFTKSGKGHTWRGSTLYCLILPFLTSSMPASVILHLLSRKQTRRCTVLFFVYKVGSTPNVEPNTGLEFMTLRSRPDLRSSRTLTRPSHPGAPRCTVFLLFLISRKHLLLLSLCEHNVIFNYSNLSPTNGHFHAVL